MQELSKKSTFLPVARRQYFTYKNQEEINRLAWYAPLTPKSLGGSFESNLISRSGSQPLDTWIPWRADIQKNTQVLTTEFLGTPTNRYCTKNHPHIDFTPPRTPYFLRTDGMNQINDTILFPTVLNDSVSIIRQLKITPPVFVNIEDVFNELYMQWRKQMKLNSYIGNSTDIYHEKIVQLGYCAVPFIINKLRTEYAHLFIALSRITGENPVKKENMGKLKEMAEDWIEWWDKQADDTSRLR